MDPSLWLALATGVGIAAACGLRAFLPLFVVGVAARLNWIELKPGLAWLAGNPVLVSLGVATTLEILADKIPAVDHALDMVATFIRPIAAWLGAYAVLVHWPTPWAQLVSVALGGGALALHAAKAKLRLGSSALTLGHGNPLLSLGEDAAAAAILVTAILAPIRALLAAGAILWVLVARRR